MPARASFSRWALITTSLGVLLAGVASVAAAPSALAVASAARVNSGVAARRLSAAIASARAPPALLWGENMDLLLKTFERARQTQLACGHGSRFESRARTGLDEFERARRTARQL